jgi:hypothetical protein
MVPAIQVGEALATAISGALSITIERRYSPYYNRSDVSAGKYLYIASGEDRDAKRGLDILELTVDVGYQIGLPEPTEAYPDPANNLPWADAQLAKVQAIKELFEDEGDLRDADFAGATYLRMTNTPLFRPELLRDNEIFTSVIRFELRTQA